MLEKLSKFYFRPFLLTFIKNLSFVRKFFYFIKNVWEKNVRKKETLKSFII